jgi:hypothetical protein
MSQFQQPQDNKFVRPGVLDLGTGRQYTRLSTSLKGEGSLGSGAQGGGFVQGSSRIGTGESGVDPLAQILGSVAQGVDAFVKSDQMMLQAREKQAKMEYEKLQREADERQRANDALDSADPNQRDPDDLLKDQMDNLLAWKSNARLSSRGDMINVTNKGLNDLSGKIKSFDFQENVHMPFLLKLKEKSGNPRAEEKLIAEYRQKWQGTKFEKMANSATNEALVSAAGRVQQRENEEIQTQLDAQFDIKLRGMGLMTVDAQGNVVPDRKGILAYMDNLKIDPTENDAAQRLSNYLLQEIRNDPEFIDDSVDPNAADAYLDAFATRVSRQASAMIAGGASYQALMDAQDDAEYSAHNYEQGLNWMAENAEALAVSPFADQAMKAFEAQTSGMLKSQWELFKLNEPDKAGRMSDRQKASWFSDRLQKGALEVAKSNNISGADAIALVAASSAGIPQDLESAKLQGWIPDDTKMTEEEYTSWLDKSVLASEAANLTVLAEDFDLAITGATTPQQLDMLQAQLSLLGRHTGPHGLLDADGRMVHGGFLSDNARAYMTIYNQLENQRARVLKNLGSANEMDFVSSGLLAGTGGVGSFLSRKGPPDNMGRSGFIQPLAHAINSGDVGAARNWLNGYTADNGTVPLALQGLHSLILTAEKTGEKVDPAALKGAMITSLAMGWNQVSMAQHDGAEYNNQQYLFADSSRTMVQDAFDNQENGVVLGEDGRMIATIWQTLDTEGRKAIFGDFYESAQLTSTLHKVENLAGDDGMFDSVPAVKTRAQLTERNVARGIGILSGEQTKALIGDPEEFTDLLATALMDPLSSTSSLPTDKNGIELISAALNGRDAGLQMLMSTWGVPESAQEQFQIAMDPYLPDIQQEMLLALYNEAGGEGVTSWLNEGKGQEEFGEWANSTFQQIVLKRTQGRVWINNQLMEDPTGNLMRLKRSASSNGKSLEGAQIADRVLGMSLYEMADGMGYDEDHAGRGFDTLQAMFPTLFEGEGTIPDEQVVLNRAFENRAIDEEQRNPKFLTVSDILIAFHQEQGMPFTDDMNSLSSAYIASDVDRLGRASGPKIVLPGANSEGLALDIPFNWPNHVTNSSSIIPLPPSMSRGREAVVRDIEMSKVNLEETRMAAVFGTLPGRSDPSDATVQQGQGHLGLNPLSDKPGTSVSLNAHGSPVQQGTPPAPSKNDIEQYENARKKFDSKVRKLGAQHNKAKQMEILEDLNSDPSFKYLRNRGFDPSGFLVTKSLDDVRYEKNAASISASYNVEQQLRAAGIRNGLKVNAQDRRALVLAIIASQAGQGENLNNHLDYLRDRDFDMGLINIDMDEVERRANIVPAGGSR